MLVQIEGQSVEVEQEVFLMLLENSVAHSRAPFQHALDESKIKYSELVNLAKIADIPIGLFFSSLEVVKAQVSLKESKLLAGATKDAFSLNSRSSVELRDIELIVRDLLRKQQLLKTVDSSLGENEIVGLLRKPGLSIKEDSRKLMNALGVSVEGIRGYKTKGKSLEYLIDHFEDRQILVARAQRLFMPQLIDGIAFSGITVKDRKIPYVFLAGSGESMDSEPAGRQIFTLTLMGVLVARGIFSPVTYQATSKPKADSREYDLVAEILMPEEEFRQFNTGSLDDMEEIASITKVTPSAVVVRSRRLKLISTETAAEYLDELHHRYQNRQSFGSTPLPEAALKRYNGTEFSRRMLQALDTNRIRPTEFCRVVTQNLLKPHEIERLRAQIS